MSTQKKNEWVVSSFDAFIPSTSTISKNISKSGNANDSFSSINDEVKLISSQAKPAAQKQLWVDKHGPTTPEELAVHKRKIEDVRTWLKTSLKSRKCNQMLLLTGPAGAGKTATVRCLAKEMKYEIHEWTNKSGTLYINAGDVCCESQMITFRSFLMHAARYSSNQIFGNGSNIGAKVILMEEFPTAVLKDVTEFHCILRHFRRFGRSPLIFIVTDSVKDDKNERHLFPKDFQVELAIVNIAFNPVAPTSLNRILTRVAHAEGFDVSKSAIESLAENSHGDIRAAVNALQFTFDHDARMKNVQPNMSKQVPKKGRCNTKKKAEKILSVDSPLALFGSRDESLFLFHALGKVLHCKREIDKKIPHSLPSVFKEMERHSLMIDPEEIFHKTSTSANSFIAFLHQNYLQFFSDVEMLAMAARYFSEADCFNCEWMEGSSLESYIFSVATRGILYCNNRHSQFGWKPLHKPGLFSAMKTYCKNRESGRCVFQEKCHHLSTEDLFTQLIPYLSKIKPKLCTDQNLFINSIGKISVFASSSVTLRDQMETLNEKDIGEDTLDLHVKECSQLVKETDSAILGSSHDTDDEDFVIEEFVD